MASMDMCIDCSSTCLSCTGRSSGEEWPAITRAPHNLPPPDAHAWQTLVAQDIVLTLKDDDGSVLEEFVLGAGGSPIEQELRLTEGRSVKVGFGQAACDAVPFEGNSIIETACIVSRVG